MDVRASFGRRTWAAVGATGLALTGVYFLLPAAGAAQLALGGVIGFVAGACLVLGAARQAVATDRLAWLLIAAGVVCFAGGDVLFGAYELTDQSPFPSAADGIYLAAYPLLLGGVLLLGRQQGRQRRFALADALIAAGALALVQWVFVMDPLVDEESGLARLILLAYPAMDILLAAGLASLLFTPAWRCPALWLLAGAILLQLAGDEVYLLLADTYASGSWVDASWLLSYVLFAAAALHPSALDLRSPAAGAALGWARIVFLGGALVAVPVALVVASPEGAELPVLVVLSAALSVLVLLRIVALTTALAAENERLLELDRLKDEFVGLVSHDLRTPLTSITGYAELLLDEEDSLREDQRRFLTVIDRNARRLQRLLDDLLFEARLQAGEPALELRQVDLAEVAADCLEESRPTAHEADVEVVLSAAGAVLVPGDRARLAQLLDNLVSNAIKFTPAGGRVEVRVTGWSEAVLEVSDTGIGIPPGEEGGLFERFSRASNARDRQLPGTGLGLHIVQAIVTAHGGAITVEPGPEGGTTFRVELPLSRRADDTGSRTP
ncbi:MAG: hypothetical protein ICV67_03860 [Thermoleophilia bacterium]|nr:hypothetical protein [Thermoleophilia bacterium]